MYNEEIDNEILTRSTFRLWHTRQKPLLIATLTAIAFVAFVCFIVLPAIALVPIAISVRRERLSRPPQTTVPVVVGLNYEKAQINLREAKS